MRDLPAGRRAALPNEHLFVGPSRKHKHLWLTTEKDHSGPVVACGVCGRLKKGEHLPESWPVLVP